MKCIHKITKLTAALFGTVTLFSCANFFQGKVDMNTSRDTTSGLYDLLTKPETITSLEAPAELHVSQNLYSNKIVVSWSPVSEATSYQLERAIVKSPDENGEWQLPEETDFSVLQSFCYQTTYTDVILQKPEYSRIEYNWRYYYRVTAQNLIKDYESSPYYPDYEVYKDKDEEGNVTGQHVDADPSIYGCLFGVPMQVEADKGKSTERISVKWTAVEEAVAYQIYRGEKDTGTDSVFFDEVYANQTSYDNILSASEQGVEFYYKVYAKNRLGEISAASPIAMGYSLKDGAPIAPETVVVENGLGTSKSEIKIKWSEVASANELTYSLYRSSSADSSYKLLSKGMKVTEFTDKTGSTDLYYYYFVRTTTQDDEGNVLNSAFSDSGKDSKNPAYGFLLSPPSSVDVDNLSNGQIRIRWLPAINVAYEDEDPISYVYVIYGDNYQNGQFTDIVANDVSGTEDGTGYLYYDIPSADYNFFKIATVNEKSEEGNKMSNKSSVAAPVPDAPENVYASKTIGFETAQKYIQAKGGSISESQWEANKFEVYPVVVTWDSVEKAEGYDVYRSAKIDSGFKKVNESPITECYYLDAYNAAKSDTFYYYKVVSLNALNQGTKSNNPVDDPAHDARGYGALTRDQWFREYNKTGKSSQEKLTLMHKSNNMDKLGSETIKGDISGTLSYKAAVAGLGAEITMHYTNFADKFISDDETLGIKFIFNGNTDTTSNMSANGNMHETVTCGTKVVDVTNPDVLAETFPNVSDAVRNAIAKTGDTHYLCGMYPGYASYDSLEIKGGSAGGGGYGVQTYDLEGNIILAEAQVSWLVGEEK